MYRPPRKEPEFDLDRIINRVKAWFGGLSQGSGGGVAGNVGASGRNFLPYLIFGLIGVGVFTS
ncbi:MAG: hypothetical protein J4G01_04280 [Dehalococcoidia bacterium]|nr:hypothetical protein [Dehalococcoidia bacterium]